MLRAIFKMYLEKFKNGEMNTTQNRNISRKIQRIKLFYNGVKAL